MSVEVPYTDQLYHDLMARWVNGAISMGALHGAYCLGCCWLLCAIMFPLGMMNIAALATITVIVFAEKTLPWVALWFEQRPSFWWATALR